MSMDKIIEVDIQKFSDDTHSHETDEVAIERAMTIKVIHLGEEHSLGILMRTPGNDIELVYGFLYCEGVISSSDDIIEINFNNDDFVVKIADGCAFDSAEHIRKTSVSSACGLCGRDSVSSLIRVNAPALPNDKKIQSSSISQSVNLLRSKQELFSRTGGSHAAAIIDYNGNLISISEDVGRHNALDKLMGTFLMDNKIPINDGFLVVSGRASFELTYKALRCGIPIFIAVGAPSSMAVEMSMEHGMTLIGFVKNEVASVYSCPSRVIID
jgi:FdhD protein